MHAARQEVVHEHQSYSNFRAVVQAVQHKTGKGSRDDPRKSVCNRRNTNMDTTQ